MNDAVHVKPLRQLAGTIRVPGDKSASHRALMISALADGVSTISGISEGHDVRATRAIVETLGVAVHEEGSILYVTGANGGLRGVDRPLQCENSGTTIRLMAGVVATIEGRHELVGDESLNRRPMDRIAVPLRRMGAHVVGRGERLFPPLEVTGRSSLEGIDYEVPEASAQVKSAVLFAGLAARSPTTVTETVLTRTTTEDMFRDAGVNISLRDRDDGRVVTLTPGRPLHHDWSIPGDPSQAAFFAVLGALHRDATIQVSGIDAAPERTGFVDVLARMGAQVALIRDGDWYALSSRSSHLVATDIHAREVPSVDEVPILSVAACAASGVTRFRDMAELRLKESDRFAGSLSLARSLGCRAWSDGNDFFIEGLGEAQRFQEFSLDAGLDHRLVMAAAFAATAGRGGTVVGASTVSSSYPNFFTDLGQLA